MRPANDRRGDQLCDAAQGSPGRRKAICSWSEPDNKWLEPSDFKLIVRDEKLKERNAFDLPKGLSLTRP